VGAARCCAPPRWGHFEEVLVHGFEHGRKTSRRVRRAAAAGALLAIATATGASCAGRQRAPARVPNASPDGGGEVAERGTGADRLDGTPVSQAEELLVGRFPGVRVTRLSNGALSVQIRGATSIHGTTEPLYVVDGLPIAAGSGGLVGINPNDIQRIQVLKDVGSTAFYGVRGANGVVLITTLKR
jgi:TonB-dependent SusC/RagA subfamily outer membrane receptor